MINMPFNLLVTTCALKEQKWRYEPKDGAPINMDALENEHVIFFEIDEKTNKTSQFREHFGFVGVKQKICDLLIFYHCEGRICEVRRDYKLLCLAESKGETLEESIQQIENTFNHIKEHFKDEKKYNSPIIWCAYVATDRFGSGPSLRRKDFRARLAGIDGIKYSGMSHESNLGHFFRNCWTRLENEKEQKKKKR